MSINKVLFFVDDGSFGWDETYYDTANYTDPAATLADLLVTWNKAIKLAQKRQACLAGGSNPCNGRICSSPQLVGIRVANLGNGETRSPRSTIFGTADGTVVTSGAQGDNPFTVIPGNAAGGGNNALGPADNPYSGVEVILTDNYPGQSKRNIAGVPDDFVCDQALKYTNNTGGAGTWITQFQNFAGELVGGNWGALHPCPALWKQRPNQAGSTGGVPNALPIVGLGGTWGGYPMPFPVQNISTGQPYVLVGGAGWNFGPGAFDPCAFWLVIVGTVAQPGSPDINGVYKASPIAPYQNTAATYTSNLFLLRHRFKPLNVLCQGWALQRQFTVSAFQRVQILRPASRKRGGPTERHRGRSRTRA